MSKLHVYIAAWVSTALAVSVAVYVTKSAAPLFAMLIPTFIVESDKKEK
ncbi:hypothetical protein [Clostridium sp. C8-1-8]|nr:hypothetical protein [Clostridium sp. C8-1-8]